VYLMTLIRKCTFGVVLFLAIFPQASWPQISLTPNGYSGYSLAPTARVLDQGEFTLDYVRVIPGVVENRGHNFQFGLGLTTFAEASLRLATQSLHCDFYQGQCPQGAMRDLSASLKVSLSPDIHGLKGWYFAAGGTDLGGAATSFQSYYAAASFRMSRFETTFGIGRRATYAAMLDGPFAGFAYHPNAWSRLAWDHVDGTQTIQASFLPLVALLPFESVPQVSTRLNHVITSERSLPRTWLGFSLGLPLGNPTRRVPIEPAKLVEDRIIRLAKGDAADLPRRIRSQGFSITRIEDKPGQGVVVWLENQSYGWNHLDAMAIALTDVVSAYEDSDRQVEVVITRFGLPVIAVRGPAACLFRMIQTGELCQKLNVMNPSELTLNIVQSALTWFGSPSIRPELLIQPAIKSLVGTEIGALDFHLGMNLTLLLPLWQGAWVDVNRLEPTGVMTQDFRRGIYQDAAKLQANTNRRMFNQLFRMPIGTSYARWSYGYLDEYRGNNVELQSLSHSGRHRVGLIAGHFRRDFPRDPIFNLPIIDADIKTTYRLWNYRYSWDDASRFQTEIVTGRFFDEDVGYQLRQRFWFDDRSVSLLLRRSKKGHGSEPVAFAGFEINLPLTPRKVPTMPSLGLRGSSDWSYQLETKILENDNLITNGYGRVPRFGEHLILWMNQDRFGRAYTEVGMRTLRDRYLEMSVNP
jgi:hypothetical protein